MKTQIISTKSRAAFPRLVLLAAGLTLAMGAAQAQTSAMAKNSYYVPGTSYIGFNVGESNFKAPNGGFGRFNSEKNDTSYSIYGGGYFNKNFGMELGYTDFGRIARAGGNTKAYGIDLSLVGKLPVNDVFAVTGRVGAIYGHTDTTANAAAGIATGTESGLGISYGVGAEYAINTNWSAVVRYDEHKLKFAGGNKETIGNTSIGLKYKF